MQVQYKGIFVSPVLAFIRPHSVDQCMEDIFVLFCIPLSYIRLVLQIFVRLWNSQNRKVSFVSVST